MPLACAQCGQAAAGGQFCDHCGARVEKPCRICAASNRPGARFCAECGAAFETAAAPAPEVVDPIGAQQKQATILFADICGSTELISKMDAEDAGDVLGPVIRTIGEALRRFGGVVNRQMGDGVMALFGAPIAIEDHAARACFAALAVLDAVQAMGARALPVRVGICSGPIILRRTGRDHEDYDVAGLTAHIAARLEQHAGPEMVLLADQTMRLVTGIAEADLVGDIALKGLAETLRVYRLRHAIDRPSWIVRSGATALSTFVGREAEYRRMSAAIARAWEGRTQAVALVADAGMGKSRLLHEVLAHLAPGEWHVMRVETTAQSTSVPYFLVTGWLREFVGCAQEDTTTEIAARLPAAIAALGTDMDFDLTPLLVQLDGAVDDAAYDTIDPADRRRRLVAALRPILRRYAQLHPLIIVVEDYHWLDASSVGLLEDLFAGLEGARLAFLVTARPERRPGWGRAGGEDAEAGARIEIALERLTPGQADHLLRELIGGAEEFAPLRAHIIARAEGTPFFLEEFARSLHESGALAAGAPPLDNIVIPASVQGILAARIDRLSAAHRRILQVASVLGRDVPSGLLASVADMPEATYAEAIAALRGGRFLIENSSASGDVHTFSHALTQAVAYESVLRSDRRVLHERVLRVLEGMSPDHPDSTVDQLAHHAVCAEAWPEAARYAMEAAERAGRRSALTEARAYLETAIAALTRQPTTLETMTMGIDARLRLRGVFASLIDEADVDQQLQQYYLAEADKLAELAGDRRYVARVYISHGSMLAHWGDLSGSLKVSRTALDVVLDDGDSVGIVSAAFALAQAQWYSGDLAAAREVLMSNIAHARDQSGHGRSAATFVLPAAVFFCYLARVQSDLGNSDAGFAALREARTIAERHGQTFDRVLVDCYEGALLLASGRLADSIVVLERALGVARTDRVEWHTPLIACALGRAYVECGRVAEARELLEAASTFADRNRHIAKRLLCAPPLIRALAEGPGGDTVGAKDLAQRTVREAAARGFRPVVVQAQIALARVLTLSGAGEAARAPLEAALGLAGQLGLLREALEARELLGALPAPAAAIDPALAASRTAAPRGRLDPARRPN